MRHDTIEHDHEATGPHEALRRYLADQAQHGTTAMCIALTAADAIAAIRIEDGQPSHVGYRGMAGDDALAGAAKDGIIALRTHRWEAGDEAPHHGAHWIPAGEKGRLGPDAARTLRGEPRVEAIERWVMEEFAPNTNPPAGEDDIAPPGTSAGENEEFELGAMLGDTRHGRCYEASDRASSETGVWIECRDAPDTHGAWVEAVRLRTEIKDRYLVPIIAIGRRGDIPGAFVTTHTGIPLATLAAKWDRHKAHSVLLRALASLVRMHIREIAHGDLNQHTVLACNAKSVNLGGLATPMGAALIDGPDAGARDNLEMAVMGRPTAASDLYALGTIMLEAISGHAPKALVEELFDADAQSATARAIEHSEASQGPLIAQFLRNALNPYPAPGDGTSIAVLRRTRTAWEGMKDAPVPAEPQNATPSAAPAPTPTPAPEHGEGEEERPGPIAQTQSAPLEIAPIAPIQSDPLGIAPIQSGDEPTEEVDDEFAQESLRLLEEEGGTDTTSESQGASRPAGPDLSQALEEFAEAELAKIVGEERARARMGRAQTEAYKRNKNRLDRFISEMTNELEGTEERETFAERLHRRAVSLSIE